MALIDRITQLLGRAAPQAQTTAQETAGALQRNAAPSEIAERFRASSERADIVKACRRMYKADTRARRMIATLARDTVRGGCAIVVPNNPRAEQEANALWKRLGVNERLDDWMRLTMRDGDSFLEAGVNGALDVVSLTRKPTLQMRRQSNAQDLFTDARRAFWYAPPMWMMPEPPSDAVWFAQWQILHARWDHDEGERYGTPLFASGASAFQRVTEGELDIAVRRKTRAGLKFNHRYPQGTSEADILADMERNQEAIDDPFAALADYYGTAELTAVQGDALLQEIGDVTYHMKTWLIAGIVPLELIGYGEDLNRDVLEEKKAQYDRDLETLTAWLEGQIVKPLLELQWLLKGIYPDTLTYEVKWKAKQSLTAATLRDVADAALKLLALGYSRAVVDALVEKFLPGIDLQVLMRQAQANAPSESARRVADVMDAEDGD